MNRLYSWIALAVFAVAVAGYFGATPLAKYLIESNFSEVSVNDRIADYLRVSGDALSQINDVSLGISVSLKTLKQMFDADIDDALTKLASRPVHLLGAIEFPDHSLAFSAEPMAMTVRGELELVLTDYEVSITSYVDIRVFARIEGDKIVYVPALGNIDVLDIDVPALAWWPFSLVDTANHALSLSIGAINGAIAEQRQAVPALSLLEQNKGLSSRFLNVKWQLNPRIWGQRRCLLTKRASWQSVRSSQRTRPAVLRLASYHLRVFQCSATHLSKNLRRPHQSLSRERTGLGSSAEDMQALALDDAYTPLSAQEATARVLGGVETRLKRITNPTFVFSADAQIVEDAIAAALANAKTLTSTTGHTFRLKEAPMVTLGNGALEAHASVVISGPGIEIEATTLRC